MLNGKKHILVVDDDENICKLMAIRLRKEDFEVSLAHSGEKGVALALEQPPDLIIMDIMMPDLDGATASGKLKENHKTKNIPIIFVTGLEKKEEEDRDSSGNYIFAKPYDPERLLKRIRELLNINRMSL